MNRGLFFVLFFGLFSLFLTYCQYQLFGCPNVNFGPLTGSQSYSPDNYCSVLLIRVEGHREPSREIRTKIQPSKSVRLELRTLRFWQLLLTRYLTVLMYSFKHKLLTQSSTNKFSFARSNNFFFCLLFVDSESTFIRRQRVNFYSSTASQLLFVDSESTFIRR